MEHVPGLQSIRVLFYILLQHDTLVWLDAWYGTKVPFQHATFGRIIIIILHGQKLVIQ